MENSSGSVPPESAILDRRDYNKETNTKKNEILFKVIELEQKLQEFDAISMEHFTRIHDLIGRIFDQPLLRTPSLVEKVAENAFGGSQKSPPATLSPITPRRRDDDDRLNIAAASNVAPDASPPKTTLAKADTNASGNDSNSSDDDYICAPQPRTESPHSLPLLLCAHESMPSRSTPRRIDANDAGTESPSNNCVLFAWIGFIVIVSFIAFVVCGADELATIEMIAKQCIEYVKTFKALMLQSLIEQSNQFHGFNEE